ncbi:MAG: site-specific DNA-methyltransferase [Actinomycetota bacterium]|nr:site-specific DNA-methyltransferase [Actinomycetota bacterium]
MTTLPRRTIVIGDAAATLRQWPPASVDCVITSPPYYALRDYGVPGQMGLEPSVHDWAASLRRVMSELARVLKPTGSLWLNLGDSYSNHARRGAPPKSLLLAPERLLLALVADGWIVRNKVIWAKPNPMPHSVPDRLNTTYEVLYFLVRRPGRGYFFDLDAIREPHRSKAARTERPVPMRPEPWVGPLAAGTQAGLRRARPANQPGHPLGKNPGDVWVLPTRGYRGAHFATFPPELVVRPLLATCPERICIGCGQPWRRKVTISIVGAKAPADRDRYVRRYPRRWETIRQRGPLHPACSCRAGWKPGIVADPFMGAGTVGLVAERFKRDWVGIELNPAYVRLAMKRIEDAQANASARSARLAA